MYINGYDNYCSNVVQIKMLYSGIHRHFKFYNRVINKYIFIFLNERIRNKNEVWEDYAEGFRTLSCFQKSFSLDFTPLEGFKLHTNLLHGKLSKQLWGLSIFRGRTILLQGDSWKAKFQTNVLQEQNMISQEHVFACYSYEMYDTPTM